MRLSSIVFLVLMSGGCEQPDQWTYSGWSMPDFFSFDGDRVWEYISTDATLPYILVGTLDTEYELLEDQVTRVFTINYTTDCVGADVACEEGELLYSVRWSSNSTWGTYIHGYSMAGGEPVVLDPALQITPPTMIKGESVTTDIEGTLWTSTLGEIEPCPVQWNVEWNECMRFDLEVGEQGDDAEGSYFPIAGTYWVITGYNLVAFELDGDSGRWELHDHAF